MFQGMGELIQSENSVRKYEVFRVVFDCLKEPQSFFASFWVDLKRSEETHGEVFGGTRFHFGGN